MKKGVLENFAKFLGKHLCQSLFFNKVAGLRPATLLKKRLWLRCFPVNFAKFSKQPFLQNTSGLLLVTSEIHMTVASGSFERKKQYRKKFSKKASRKCPLFYNFALLRRKVTIPYNKVLREVLSPSLVLTLTSISPTSKILFY